MNMEKLKELLESFKNGSVSTEDVLESLKTLPYEDIGIARLDHHRSLRTGYPEAVYCAGKKPEHIQKIVEHFVAKKVNMLLTRATEDVFNMARKIEPEVEWNETGRMVWKIYNPLPETEKPVLVIAAGTSDIPVAEEARITAMTMGCRTVCLYDVGVAGLHRLLADVERLDEAGAIVVAAGMEGALASVVGGLTRRPIVACPTSIGYGASFGGLSALLGMLNSCAPGVAVVNIDNGFGAGYYAAVICRQTDERKL